MMIEQKQFEEYRNDHKEDIKVINENLHHINYRLNDFADHLQSALNPTIKLMNGEENEVLLTDAVSGLYYDVKTIKKHTEILRDLCEIKKYYTVLIAKMKKILKIIWTL